MRFTGYSDDIELFMQQLYVSLSERDRRRYAAVEAVKLGYGSILYLVVAQWCGITPHYSPSIGFDATINCSDE